MLRNYSKHRALVISVALSLWTVVGYYIAAILVAIVSVVLEPVLSGMSSVSQGSVMMGMTFIAVPLVIIGLPMAVHNIRVRGETIGLNRLPTWTDILLGVAGFVLYIALTILMFSIVSLIPGFDPNEAQELPFTQLNGSYEALLVFAVLVVLTPIVEEIIFRGYLFGALRKNISFIGATLLTSLVFGFLHGALNVGVDVFALSVIMCVMREVTGNVWASILIHMIKNGLAYYFLFIA
jgi:membrane protease YdiL (CAAX protease family)